MMNIEKKIEETKKRLEDARERQFDFDLDADWNEDLDDYTASSTQLMDAHTDEVEALEELLLSVSTLTNRDCEEKSVNKILL